MGKVKTSQKKGANAREKISESQKEDGSAKPRKVVKTRSKDTKARRAKKGFNSISTIPRESTSSEDDDSLEFKRMALGLVKKLQDTKGRIVGSLNKTLRTVKLEFEPRYLSLDYNKEFQALFGMPKEKTVRRGRSKDVKSSATVEAELKETNFVDACNKLSHQEAISGLIPLAHSSALTEEVGVPEEKPAKSIKFNETPPNLEEKLIKAVKFTETPQAPCKSLKHTGTPGTTRTPQVFRWPAIGEAAISTAGSPLIVTENVSAPLLSVPTVDGRLVALVPPLDDSSALGDECVPRVAPPVRRQLAIIKKYINQVLQQG